ncbi:cytochrome P450 [Aspergillus navahoensis]
MNLPFFFAFDILGEVTFSQSFGFLEEGIDLRNAIANTGFLVYYTPIIGNYVWFHNLTLGNPLVSRLGLQPNSHIFNACLLAINSRKHNPELRHNMMQRWLDMRASHLERISEDVFGPAVANVGAGAETISSMAQADIYYLRKNPQYPAMVRNDLDEAQVIHRNADIFGADCNTYNTTRWLQGDTKKMDYFLIHVRSPLSLPPCPDLFAYSGAQATTNARRYLAQFKLSKVLATVLRDYEIDLVDPKSEWRFENLFLLCRMGCRVGFGGGSGGRSRWLYRV